jgi:hypothetical protein
MAVEAPPYASPVDEKGERLTTAWMRWFTKVYVKLSYAGYSVGDGGAVTQATSRTTLVTLNNLAGAITLFSAAGSATAATFTVNNTLIGPNDVVTLAVKSSTNTYLLGVTSTTIGAFSVTFFTTGGVAVDAPIFNFVVLKGSNI